MNAFNPCMLCRYMVLKVSMPVHSKKPVVTLNDVSWSVNHILKIGIKDLRGNLRKREFSDARHIAYSLAKKHTKNSLKSIAAYFHKSNHSSIIYGLKQCESLKRTNRDYRIIYNTINTVLINKTKERETTA